MKSTTNPDVVLVAYVPAPHAGYIKLFQAYSRKVLYLLGDGFIREFKSLTRHLPGATPEENRKMIKALGIFSDVRILDEESCIGIRNSGSCVVMPDEDVSQAIAARYFSGVKITFDNSWRLRWDWGTTTNAHRRPEGERRVSTETLDRELMLTAKKAAERSPDWWRQIGAVLVKDGKVLLVAFNRHVPSEQSAYLCGDPRSNFDPGQHIDASLALHGEAGIVAEAARRGISMSGCDLYVTTFPCPPCAHLCAYSGIRRLYYADGYSLVAGAEVLESRSVEIIRVEM